MELGWGMVFSHLLPSGIFPLQLSCCGADLIADVKPRLFNGRNLPSQTLGNIRNCTEGVPIVAQEVENPTTAAWVFTEVWVQSQAWCNGLRDPSLSAI